MKHLILCILSSCISICYGQDTLFLERCHTLASEYAPRMKDIKEIQSISDLKINNTVTNWYPEMNLNGKFSYQSDVVTVALADPSIPVEFPEVPYDQYSLNLDITQLIYDGGITKHSKAYEQASTAAELQQVEVDIYKLKEQVNSIYFSILILQENRKNLELTLENLKEREKMIQSGVENGILLESDLKVLKVETLKILHSLVEIDAGKSAFINMLGIYLGVDLSEDVILQKPFLEPSREKSGFRPEYEWFELQSLTLEAGKGLARSKRMPRFFAFGQAGYGSPGYNMLSDEWDLYYMVGAGVKWNIWDWNKSSRERKILEHKQNTIRNHRATFEQGVKAQLSREEAKMEQYSKSLDLDKKMLELQKEIAEEAGSKLENGTMTATEYLIEINKENMARIRVDTDKVLFTQAIANYMTIIGTL